MHKISITCRSHDVKSPNVVMASVQRTVGLSHKLPDTQRSRQSQALLVHLQLRPGSLVPSHNNSSTMAATMDKETLEYIMRGITSRDRCVIQAC
jgi:hypothetical protein